jgi:pimeloyl-ACP methyl ester carboxylesterase
MWLIVLLLASWQAAGAAEALGIALEGYPYPHPVAFRSFEVDRQPVRMAYMDVKPSGSANGRTVVLFHGKNFFGAYWRDTIEKLRAAGYRVVVPDQIGFGKSSKPDIPYSFHEMGRHTKSLLDELGVKETAVVGHSMGGMLAVRFALMYPDTVSRLVLENPIGFEDYRAKVPSVPTSKIYETEMKRTEESIRAYHRNYYVQWKPSYDEWVQVHYRWTLSGEHPRLAKASALTAQMIYEQPVVHEFPLIRTKTLLIIGQEDRTAMGKDRVSEEQRKTLGNYPELGKAAAKAIPDSRLIALEGIGHVPHFEAPERFHQELLEFLQ